MLLNAERIFHYSVEHYYVLHGAGRVTDCLISQPGLIGTASHPVYESDRWLEFRWAKHVDRADRQQYKGSAGRP